MAFWIWQRFSWACFFCLLAPLAQAQEPVAPWLFHPLDGTSQLKLSQIVASYDYSQSARPGFVRFEFQAHLAAPASHSLEESFLIVNSDPESVLEWKGRPVVQERLVMPLTTFSDSGESIMTRVSVFQLALLSGEDGELSFRGNLPLDYLSPHVHRLRLVMPVSKSWAATENAEWSLRLVPGLRLIHPAGIERDPPAQVHQQMVSSYHRGPVELRLSSDWQPWGQLGALAAVPALKRQWLWGGAALVLACAFSAWRGLWWALPFLALGLHWWFLRFDPIAAQWTFYRDAGIYAQAIHVYRWYVIPGLALLAGVCLKLSRRRSCDE